MSPEELQMLLAQYSGPEVVDHPSRATDALQSIEPLLGMIPIAKGSSAMGQGLMALQGMMGTNDAEAAPGAASIASLLANFFKRPETATRLLNFTDHDTTGLLKVAADNDVAGTARLIQAQRQALKPNVSIPNPNSTQVDMFMDRGGLSALRALRGR
jgi:hypothetical protein